VLGELLAEGVDLRAPHGDRVHWPLAGAAPRDEADHEVVRRLLQLGEDLVAHELGDALAAHRRERVGAAEEAARGRRDHDAQPGPGPRLVEQRAQRLELPVGAVVSIGRRQVCCSVRRPPRRERRTAFSVPSETSMPRAAPPNALMVRS
jgi:hypothetical protein